MRWRSPSTSSGARSRGLAMMPRIRTAPSITGGGASVPFSSRRTIGVRRWLARKRGRSYRNSHGTLSSGGAAASDSVMRVP